MEAQQTARKYVAERLTETRQQQLSTATVKSLIQENENVKRTMEANLRALLDSQVQGAETTMVLLADCSKKLPTIQGKFTEMDVMAKDAAELLRDFPYELNQVRENLFQTRRLLRDLMQVDSRVVKVKALLEDEEKLLDAHTELAALVEMRAQAVIDARKAGDRHVIEGVERYFKSVGKLEHKFDELIKQHMDNTFELARKRPSLLKQLLKVIELEEKSDRNRPPDMVKGYYMTFREKLRESLENRFNAIFSNAVQTDITDALRIVEQIYDNLPIIQQVNRYFPSKYMMYDMYAGNMHRNLRASLAKIAARTSLNAADVVNLYYWSNVSYVKKLEGLGLNPRDWPISDTLRAAIPTYSSYLRNLMNQWSARLLERDRVNPSFVEMPKNLMTDSIVTLFKFVNQQLDLVSNTKDSHFVFEVAKETTQVVYDFQRAQTEVLNTYAKDLHMKYLLALLNNNAKAYEYTEEYEFKVRGLLTEPELSRFEKEDRQGLVDGFEEVRKLCVSCVVQQIFDLFKESNMLAKLFTKEWIQASADEYNPMEVIVQTLADAIEQMVKRHLRDKYVSDVAKEALDRLMQRYVQELCSKSGYNAETVRAIERDKELIENSFTNVVQGKSYLTRRLNLMTSIISFLQTQMDDQGQFILTYNALLEDYPDLTPEIVKRIIMCRSDCDKDALNDVIAACRGILPSVKQFKPFFASIIIKK